MISAIFSAVSVLLVGAVATDDPGWQRTNVYIEHAGPRRAWRASVAIPAIYVGGDEAFGPALLCDGSGYQVRFPIEPGNMRDMVRGVQSRRIRQKRMTLVIDGEDVWQGQAQRWTQLNTVIPEGNRPAAKVFNAVVKRQSVSIRPRPRANAIAMATPAVDEVFRTFAEDCAALRASSGN